MWNHHPENPFKFHQISSSTCWEASWYPLDLRPLTRLFSGESSARNFSKSLKHLDVWKVGSFTSDAEKVMVMHIENHWNKQSIAKWKELILILFRTNSHAVPRIISVSMLSLSFSSACGSFFVKEFLQIWRQGLSRWSSLMQNTQTSTTKHGKHRACWESHAGRPWSWTQDVPYSKRHPLGLKSPQWWRPIPTASMAETLC